MSLLASRRLLPLLVTQTLGAVNDNLFKNALVVMILFGTAQAQGRCWWRWPARCSSRPTSCCPPPPARSRTGSTRRAASS